MAKPKEPFNPAASLDEWWDEQPEELRALAAQFAPYIHATFSDGELTAVERDEERYQAAKDAWDAAEQARYDAEVWAEEHPYTEPETPETIDYAAVVAGLLEGVGIE